MRPKKDINNYIKEFNNKIKNKNCNIRIEDLKSVIPFQIPDSLNREIVPNPRNKKIFF